MSKQLVLRGHDHIPSLRMERRTKQVIDISWQRSFFLPRENVWNLIKDPGALRGLIPMLDDWSADGPLMPKQTGYEIHSFLPGVRTLYFWKMLVYENNYRWVMFSKPAAKTVFNLPHLTDYRIIQQSEDSCTLVIRFQVECNGIFTLPGITRLVRLKMHKTVRDLLEKLN